MRIDGEQIRNTTSKIGRGVAAAGLLFTAACQQSSNEISLKIVGNNFEITQISHHIYHVSGGGFFQRDGVSHGLDWIKRRCAIEATYQPKIYESDVNVIVEQPDCITELNLKGPQTPI